MKIKKAFWVSLALVPATIVPLSTATSCSQAWGFKTPLSIGSSIKSSKLNPFNKFSDTTMTDLNGESIVDYLQSNYAVDTRVNNMYGYSLPQKWNDKKDAEVDPYITWEKGGYEDASAGWYDYSSSDFVKSSTRKGVREVDKVNVLEALYSYRNNTLASTIQLVGSIGQSISSLLNYALQYQGTQIGTKYQESESGTNLATSWGGNINHGTQDSTENKQFFESIFAANAVSGTAKAKAALHPTHVEFEFNDAMFPVVAYNYDSTTKKVTGVHNNTLMLLNGVAERPSKITSNKYWSAETTDQTEKVTDIRTKEEHTYTYKVYTYTNVPVLIDFNSLTRSYVDPTKNDSFIVSDYYAETKEINNAVGDSWKKTLPEFTTPDATKPSYCAFSYKNINQKAIELSTADNVDTRIAGKLKQNQFIVLMNYAYKEYKDNPELDRVTMTGLSSIIPAYLLDKSVELGETTFFKVASKDTGKGYIVDSDKVNKYYGLLVELLKRSSGQGLITEANKLNDTSKQLLKLLSFMFGDADLKVNTKDFITTYDLK